MKKKAFLLIAATITLLYACKKSDSSSSQPTAQQKIQAKWRYVSTAVNNYYSGSPHVVTLNGNAADYADFRSDNKVYSYTTGTYDTSAYTIINDTKMWIDTPQDEYEIKKLTTAEFILYKKETISATEYTETTITLNK